MKNGWQRKDKRQTNATHETNCGRENHRGKSGETLGMSEELRHPETKGKKKEKTEAESSRSQEDP